MIEAQVHADPYGQHVVCAVEGWYVVVVVASVVLAARREGEATRDGIGARVRANGAEAGHETAVGGDDVVRIVDAERLYESEVERAVANQAHVAEVGRMETRLLRQRGAARRRRGRALALGERVVGRQRREGRRRIVRQCGRRWRGIRCWWRRGRRGRCRRRRRCAGGCWWRRGWNGRVRWS